MPAGCADIRHSEIVFFSVAKYTTQPTDSQDSVSIHFQTSASRADLIHGSSSTSWMPLMPDSDKPNTLLFFAPAILQKG